MYGGVMTYDGADKNEFLLCNVEDQVMPEVTL
jgi:hypothetical protein